MDYVKYIDLFGEPVATIPCIVGSVAPTAATFGKVGCLYMNDKNGSVYACTAAADGAYTWVPIAGGSGASEVFIAEYSKTTFAEMDEAYSAGKVLFLRTGSYLVPMYNIEAGTSVSFYRTTSTQIINYYRTAKGNWSQKTLNLCAATHEELESQIQALEERIAQLEAAVAEPITFTFRGVEHTARRGMTWAEFVVSNYNPTVECPAGCGDMISEFIIDNDQVSYSEPYVCLDNSCGPLEAIYNDQGDYVLGSDTIISGHAYY